MSMHNKQQPIGPEVAYSNRAATTVGEPADGGHSNCGLGQRRRRDAVILALLALVAVLRLRAGGQAGSVIVCEAMSMLVLLAVAAVAPRLWRGPQSRAFSLRWFATTSAILVPLGTRITLQVVSDSPTAWEMVMLTTLGSAAIALALCSPQPRHAALSVVCSGFLLLFTTAISDRVETFYLAILWMLICLWWMLANHWERLEVHLAQSVHRHQRIRFAMTLLGISVCGLAVAATWGRGPSARMLDGGVMPTSGGNRWSDPGARSGVGDGDAVVAAKQHAASFGAVESDVFMESRQSSLFDLFDDVFGKTKPTVRSEKTVSLANFSCHATADEPAPSRSRAALRSRLLVKRFKNAHAPASKSPRPWCSGLARRAFR